MAKPEEFDIEKMFAHYLELTEQKKEELSEVQYKEIKQAFMAGISVYQRTAVDYLQGNIDTAVNFFDAMEEQLRNYWNQFLPKDEN